jgi:DNA-binding response OmpR family regulator
MIVTGVEDRSLEGDPQTLRLHDGTPKPANEWTVLVAEDDADIRELLTWQLELAGYHTVQAHDGPSSLAAVAREHPDAIILDVTLPGLSGIDVCFQLRADARTNRTQVLMLSGRIKNDDVDLAMAMGADVYMTKPFRIEDLLRTLRWLLPTRD